MKLSQKNGSNQAYIKFAEEGFITCLSDVVINAIEIVQEYLDRENEHGII
jgi:cyanophycin synthetase